MRVGGEWELGTVSPWQCLLMVAPRMLRELHVLRAAAAEPRAPAGYEGNCATRAP